MNKTLPSNVATKARGMRGTTTQERMRAEILVWNGFGKQGRRSDMRREFAKRRKNKIGRADIAPDRQLISTTENR
jgi:hypothetical protein